MFGKGKTYAESTPTVRRRAALLKVQEGGGAARRGGGSIASRASEVAVSIMCACRVGFWLSRRWRTAGHYEHFCQNMCKKYVEILVTNCINFSEIL